MTHVTHITHITHMAHMPHMTHNRDYGAIYMAAGDDDYNVSLSHTLHT